MESSLQLEPKSTDIESADNVHPGVTLLTTLYNEKDLLLFRPVETWTEGDRKRSRVDYSHVRYRHTNRDGLQRFISNFDFESQKEFTNQFFGVCPRVADQGRFDLAWQIRTVRCLWATSTTAMFQSHSSEFHQPHCLIQRRRQQRQRCAPLLETGATLCHR